MTDRGVLSDRDAETSSTESSSDGSLLYFNVNLPFTGQLGPETLPDPDRRERLFEKMEPEKLVYTKHDTFNLLQQHDYYNQITGERIITTYESEGRQWKLHETVAVIALGANRGGGILLIWSLLTRSVEEWYSKTEWCIAEGYPRTSYSVKSVRLGQWEPWTEGYHVKFAGRRAPVH